jgi:hypothetical protein
MGSCSGTAFAPRRSRIVRTTRSVPVRLPPDRLRLGLHARDAAEHPDRAVEHPQGTLDLDGKVDVARRVDDVDAMALPGARRGGRGDRDATLLLLLHPVHDGGAVVDLSHLVADASVEEDPLGRSRLAGVDVRHDADVACPLDRGRAGHGMDLVDLRFAVRSVRSSLVFAAPMCSTSLACPSDLRSASPRCAAFNLAGSLPAPLRGDCGYQR